MSFGAGLARLRRAARSCALSGRRCAWNDRRAHRARVSCARRAARARSSRWRALSEPHARSLQAHLRIRSAPSGERRMSPRKKKTDDETLKRAIVDFALTHAAFDGFTDRLLARAASEAGADKAKTALLFPDGVLSLIEAYSIFADSEMEETLAKREIKAMKVR